MIQISAICARGSVLQFEGAHVVYREFDQAELGAQYNNRGRIPDHQAYSDHRTAASVDARVFIPCRLDISYADHPREGLDLFFPADLSPPSGAPVHAFIHGGYWYAQAKENLANIAAGLTQADAVVAVIEYALCPDVDIPEIVRQNRAAKAWLGRNVAAVGGDPSRMYVSCHSAGGTCQP